MERHALYWGPAPWMGELIEWHKRGIGCCHSTCLDTCSNSAAAGDAVAGGGGGGGVGVVAAADDDDGVVDDDDAVVGALYVACSLE